MDGPTPREGILALQRWVDVNFGLYRYRLLEIVPIARSEVVSNLEDGVLVIDSNRRIVGIENSSATSEATTGQSVSLARERE